MTDPPSRRGLFPARTPLRTVHEGFPSYGSSLASPDLWDEAGRHSDQGKYCPVRLGLAGLSTNAPCEAAARLKILRIDWVIGVGIPSDLEIAMNPGADRLIDFECCVHSVCLSETDCKPPVRVCHREVLSSSPLGGLFGVSSFGSAPECQINLIVHLAEGPLGSGVLIVVGPTL